MSSASWCPAVFIAALLIVVSPTSAADPIPVRDVAGEVMDLFNRQTLNETILEAAKSLFVTLATVSLVWTMGLLILRQDIGEMLMELLRFMVVTGIFYWLLINASSRGGGEGFVDDIIQSFFRMVNDSSSDELIEDNANSILARGLHVFYTVMDETDGGEIADRILSVLIATAILALCAMMAAQFVLALVMAWVLGYAGIFLLGFGGARWTSQIAINFYKHVLAVGVALLSISLISTVAAGFLNGLEFGQSTRSVSTFSYLGLMLGGSILMMVLSTKIPQLLYTLVTGSTLGLYTGSASAAGMAIATAGASARSASSGYFPGGGGHSHGGPGGSSGQSSRTDSVMDAVQRSAAMAGGMSDPFHVGAGSDPFGVPRRSDPHRQGGSSSVFADSSPTTTMAGVDAIGAGTQTSMARSVAGAADEPTVDASAASSGTSRTSSSTTTERADAAQTRGEPEPMSVEQDTRADAPMISRQGSPERSTDTTLGEASAVDAQRLPQDTPHDTSNSPPSTETSSTTAGMRHEAVDTSVSLTDQVQGSAHDASDGTAHAITSDGRRHTTLSSVDVVDSAVQIDGVDETPSTTLPAASGGIDIHDTTMTAATAVDALPSGTSGVASLMGVTEQGDLAQSHGAPEPMSVERDTRAETPIIARQGSPEMSTDTTVTEASAVDAQRLAPDMPRNTSDTTIETSTHSPSPDAIVTRTDHDGAAQGAVAGGIGRRDTTMTPGLTTPTVNGAKSSPDIDDPVCASPMLDSPASTVVTSTMAGRKHEAVDTSASLADQGSISVHGDSDRAEHASSSDERRHVTSSSGEGVEAVVQTDMAAVDATESAHAVVLPGATVHSMSPAETSASVDDTTVVSDETVAVKRKRRQHDVHTATPPVVQPVDDLSKDELPKDDTA